MASFDEIRAELPRVDEPNVLELAATNPALRLALELSRPDNWHGTGLGPNELLPIAEAGIPVVWVPSARVLAALVESPPADRPDTLVAHASEVVAHLRIVVDDCKDPWLHDAKQLLGKALDAFHAGHHEAAMALGVALGEPLALWASEPRVKFFRSDAAEREWERRIKDRANKYSLAKLELEVDATGQAIPNLFDFGVTRRAFILPIPHFFTPFFPERGDPIPATASRHVAVHQPVAAHFGRSNALIVLMLCASILREEQDWCEEVRFSEQQPENVWDWEDEQ